MGPRLQGELRPDGRLALSLWGAGALAEAQVTPLAPPFVYAPNQLLAAGGGLHVTRRAPVLIIRGARLIRVKPARRSAAWDRSPGRAEVSVDASRTRVTLPWAVVVFEQRGPDLVVGAGADDAELARALSLSVEAIGAEASAYAAACDRLTDAEPLLRSMVAAGTHAALANVRADAAGRFAGVSAGPAYSTPARTYFRDSYWTMPMLRHALPEVVPLQLDLLATAVHADGEAPSGVLAGAPEERRRFERWRADDPEASGWRPGDWWSDHFDSPLFFILAVAEQAERDGSPDAVDRWRAPLRAVFERYDRLAGEDGAPPKPRNDRDWADNVYRSGLVAYDLGLWIGAAEAMARLERERDPALAARALRAAARARSASERLWREADGCWADYAALDGFVESHLALDSLTLLRWGSTPPERARRVLDAAAARLESRRIARQPHGDWGVLCAWPPYRRRGDLRGKSAFPLRYHNGGDWPWLDGLYAEARLRRGLPGWRYPLLRWWRSCLERGWTSPVEHFSPVYGRGSLLQAWSSFPAAVALEHRSAVLAGDPEDG